MPVAASAVRRFHQDGAESALTYLNQTFDRSQHWGPNGRAQARGWADAIRRSFDSYVDRASTDRRPVLGATIAADVPIGGHVVGVTIDVVLLDDDGYVGRYLLWDTPELTENLGELLSATIVLALGSELGAERISAVEVWQLRDEVNLLVSAPRALARLGDVEAILGAFLGEP